jgi:uncharacterized protein (TIGR02246 family)
MERSDVESWVDRYRSAWDSNDPEEIAALFSADAEYATSPDATPWSGQTDIVSRWLERRDERGETEFRYSVIAVDGDLGVVRGSTSYRSTPPRRYHNLWLVTLDEQGRCRNFVEWWVEQPH